MKRIIPYSLVLVLSLYSCSNPTEKILKIKRGTNISHRLSQSDRRGSERENFITEKDMDLIAEVGYDHIRLPVDE